MESVYAGNVMRDYLDLWDGLQPVYGLDCGASDQPEAVRIREYWQGRPVQWDAVDVNLVTADIYEERYECRIGEFVETGYDLILCLSVIEHSGAFGDVPLAALNALRHALSPKGILILSLPVGIPTHLADLEQFHAQDMDWLLAQSFDIVDKRFWLWDGDNFENVQVEDTANAMYGVTGNALCAAGVGAWVLARRGDGLMRQEAAAGRCSRGECAVPEEGGRVAASQVPWVRSDMGVALPAGAVPCVQSDCCNGGGGG